MPRTRIRLRLGSRMAARTSGIRYKKNLGAKQKVDKTDGGKKKSDKGKKKELPINRHGTK